MGCVVMSGIRYIGYLLHPVCARKIQRRDPLALNDFIATLDILKIEKGDPLVTFKNYLRNVISGVC